jgi:hypothetical protein
LLLPLGITTGFVLLAPFLLLGLSLVVTALLVFLAARFLLLLPLTRAFDTPFITARTVLGLRDTNCGDKAETETDHKCP